MALSKINYAASRAYNSSSSLVGNVTGEVSRHVYNLPQTYSKYVAANAASVSKIEAALRSLTYLLPGARLHDSELASESLHTFIQLLSIYHDNLLKKRALLIDASPTLSRAKPTTGEKKKQSPHARYTMFWSNTSGLYAKIATLLKMAQYTELLWEMLAKRRGGEKSRWRVVVLLEGFKAVCRLILMRLTNSRPLVSPPLPLREDFAPVEEESDEEFSEEELKMVAEQESFNPHNAFGEAGVPTPPLSESEKVPSINFLDRFTMPRTGMTMSTLPSPETISSYLLNHVITPDDVKPAKQLLHRLTSLQGQAAEVMYILRPVIYAVLMQQAARRYGYEGTKWKKNWTPWLIGISIEYLSRQMAQRDLSARVPGGTRTGLSVLEREELTKRGWNMAWWGMRGAFYENVTKKWVVGFADSLKGKPLLDLVGGVVEDYEHLWGTYHFSNATM
jgi:peroxin-16